MWGFIRWGQMLFKIMIRKLSKVAVIVLISYFMAIFFVFHWNVTVEMNAKSTKMQMYLLNHTIYVFLYQKSEILDIPIGLN